MNSPEELSQPPYKHQNAFIATSILLATEVFVGGPTLSIIEHGDPANYEALNNTYLGILAATIGAVSINAFRFMHNLPLRSNSASETE